MGAFFSATVGPWPAVSLLVLAVACAVTDLWKGRIYNAVTYPAIVLGFVLAIALHGKAGFFSALGGFAVGFFPGFLLFALGAMGGGDVKLLGAVGAIAGAVAATETLILAFVIGGFLALAKLAWHGQLFRTLGRTLRTMAAFVVPGLGRPTEEQAPKRLEIKFGVAIAIATLATLWDLRSGALSGLVM